MKLINSLFISLLSLTGTVLAQNEPGTSMLWEISGNGLSKPSYLFGTFHAICSNDIIVNNKVLKEKLDATSQLCFEIDYDEGGKMLKMMKGAFIKTDDRINTLFSAADYEYLSRFFVDSMDTEIEKFNKLKPMFLSAYMLTKTLGCQPLSMEGEIMKLVKKKDRKVLGLETIEDQMSVFDSIPLKKQAEMLLESARSFTESKVELKKMFDLYATNNLDKLYEVFIQSPDMKGEEELLLNRRNRNWIPVIQKITREKPTFIAVGAAHLPGEKGVIALLRKAGYTVNPII